MQTVRGSGGTSVRLSDTMAPRVAYVVRQVEGMGGKLYLDEGYRPTGVYSDTAVRDASQTSEGVSTQWFQVGRMWRGETPSAIIPNADGSNLSRHRSGDAIDWNAPTERDMMLRAVAMERAGLVANVPSESWHAEALRAPTVDLDPVTPVMIAEYEPGRIVRIAGHGTRCYLLHGAGILDCATSDQLDVAFVITGQDRGDIPTITLAQYEAWGAHVQWGVPAGVFRTLDRHEATLTAIDQKIGSQLE